MSLFTDVLQIKTSMWLFQNQCRYCSCFATLCEGVGPAILTNRLVELSVGMAQMRACHESADPAAMN